MNSDFWLAPSGAAFFRGLIFSADQLSRELFSSERSCPRNLRFLKSCLQNEPSCPRLTQSEGTLILYHKQSLPHALGTLNPLPILPNFVVAYLTTLPQSPII